LPSRAGTRQPAAARAPVIVEYWEEPQSARSRRGIGLLPGLPKTTWQTQRVNGLRHPGRRVREMLIARSIVASKLRKASYRNGAQEGQRVGGGGWLITGAYFPVRTAR
jgi:hypothetical protein